MPNVRTEAFQIYPLPETCNYTEGPTTKEALLSSSLLSPNMLSFVRSIPSFAAAAAADGFAFGSRGRKRSRAAAAGAAAPNQGWTSRERGEGIRQTSFCSK